MGLDVRDLPRAAVESLPDRLCAAGFEVDVTREPHSQIPGAILIRIQCRRGGDVQSLVWLDENGEPEECRVFIPNARAWRASVRDRRRRLQADVTDVIEQAGGRFPSH